MSRRRATIGLAGSFGAGLRHAGAHRRVTRPLPATHTTTGTRAEPSTLNTPTARGRSWPVSVRQRSYR